MTCYCSIGTDVRQIREEVWGYGQGSFCYWLVMHPWSPLYSGATCLTPSSTVLHLCCSLLSILNRLLPQHLSGLTPVSTVVHYSSPWHTVNWNFQNCEPKYTFFLPKLLVSVTSCNERKLEQRLTTATNKTGPFYSRLSLRLHECFLSVFHSILLHSGWL